MAFWSLAKQPSGQPQSAEPAATMDAATLKAELGHAYHRGRTDERSRRVCRGAMLAGLAALAAVGVSFLALGARDGSFAAAGGEIDHAAAQALSALQATR